MLCRRELSAFLARNISYSTSSTILGCQSHRPLSSTALCLATRLNSCCPSTQTRQMSSSPKWKWEEIRLKRSRKRNPEKQHIVAPPTAPRSTFEREPAPHSDIPEPASSSTNQNQISFRRKSPAASAADWARRERGPRSGWTDHLAKNRLTKEVGTAMKELFDVGTIKRKLGDIASPQAVQRNPAYRSVYADRAGMPKKAWPTSRTH
ncbi:hypothetical protein C8J56DRAFT_93402 [Mycena floridula]|nr:hypothetical protein C8J56DRAFT_93402 [Mycena floridula]